MSVCPAHQVFLRAYAPLISISKALQARLPRLGMACKNGKIQVEFGIFLKSSGELAPLGSLLCVVICPQRSIVASRPLCPPFPVIDPWPVLSIFTIFLKASQFVIFVSWIYFCPQYSL